MLDLLVSRVLTELVLDEVTHLVRRLECPTTLESFTRDTNRLLVLLFFIASDQFLYDSVLHLSLLEFIVDDLSRKAQVMVCL